MDIIILIWLSFQINKKAKEKGLTPSIWVVKLISLFITTELVVAFTIISFAGMENIFLIMVPALSLSVLSALFVFNQLKNQDSQIELDIEEEATEEEKPNLDHFR